MQVQAIGSCWEGGRGNNYWVHDSVEGHGSDYHKHSRYQEDILILPVAVVAAPRTMLNKQPAFRLSLASLGLRVLTVFCLGLIATATHAARSTTAWPQADRGLLAAPDGDDSVATNVKKTLEVPTAMPAGDAMAQLNRALDLGDDPLKAGCVCIYTLPDCQGQVSGRVVDECYPPDGVTLQENTMRGSCGYGEQKRYNCEEVLGNGARCELQTVDCCGVTTRSARCVLP